MFYIFQLSSRHFIMYFFWILLKKQRKKSILINNNKKETNFSTNSEFPGLEFIFMCADIFQIMLDFVFSCACKLLSVNNP